jgi:diguanylate cyclase (GGDEF)-like protein/hemerythrin-like metal-binding protein
MHSHPVGSPPTLEASLKLLLDRAALALAVVRDGHLACTSLKFDDLFGLTAGTTAGKPVVDLSAAADRERMALAVEGAASTAGEPLDPADPACFTFTLCFDALRADGSIFQAEMLATAGEIEDGPATVLLVNDVTERRRVETQLGHLAFLDSLTSLPNRALFVDRLHQTFLAAREDGRMFAVMVGDLDGFKQVNDSLGHEAGDAVLRGVARRLLGAVRTSDTVARMGGDEFGVLLPQVARREDVALVAERMVRAMDAPIVVGGVSCQLGISIGIATFPADGDDMGTLLGRADAAMYKSKRAGWNRFAFARSEAGESAPARAALFEWTEALAVGIAPVDTQHRDLVAQLNQLVADLHAGRPPEEVVDSLRALVAFAAGHFAAEERLMETWPGWPPEAAHRHEHKKLMRDVMSLALSVEVPSLTLTVHFLQDWLFNHMESMDKPMAAWLQAQGEA